MKDEACIEFLQWCLPRLNYRWHGFRKVRGQVCKRVSRRLAELELPDLPSYRDYLESNDDEWKKLDSFCHITISRFYRDRGVFNILKMEVIPSLAISVVKQQDTAVQCWSAGCCSGEEPYTLKLIWDLEVLPRLGVEIPLQIVATDSNSHLLNRAQRALFSASNIKELPQELVRQAFDRQGNGYLLRSQFKTGIAFIEQDIRDHVPEGEYHLILCRNLAFTYFEENLQNQILDKIVNKLKPGGFLVVGAHESLPRREEILMPHVRNKSIYQKVVVNPN